MRLLHVLAALWLALAVPFIQGCTAAGVAAEVPPQNDIAEGSASTGMPASPPAFPAAEAATVEPISTTGMSNAELSRRLTDWLHSHRLPLVAAQVHTNSDGQRQVILYGFVATSFGKQDAADKARKLLGNESCALSNRIAIRPELAAQSSSRPSAAPAPPSAQKALLDDQAGAEFPGPQDYQQQQQQSPQTSWTADLLPILMFAAVIGLTFVTGGAPAYPGLFPAYP